jgi:hypothetical protein
MYEEVEDAMEEPRQRPHFPVRVPGFIGDEVIGLGDAIKHATSTVGIRPCGGCGRRAEALNRLVAFRQRQRQSPSLPW